MAKILEFLVSLLQYPTCPAQVAPHPTARTQETLLPFTKATLAPLLPEASARRSGPPRKELQTHRRGACSLLGEEEQGGAGHPDLFLGSSAAARFDD